MRTPASAVILVRGDLFAFQRRDANAPTNKYKLALFGGSVELNETPFDGAVRELREETSLAFSPEDIVEVCSYYREDVDRMQYLFEFKTAQDTFEVFEGEGVEWYSLGDILGRSDITDGLRMALLKYAEAKVKEK